MKSIKFSNLGLISLLCGSFLFLHTVCANANEKEALIDPGCQQIMLLAQEDFERSITENTDPLEQFQRTSETLTECQFEYAFAALQTQTNFENMLALQLALEAWQVGPEAKEEYALAQALTTIQLEKAGITISHFQQEQFKSKVKTFEENLDELFKEFQAKAKEQNQPLTIGRFVFTRGRPAPYTLYDYPEKMRSFSKDQLKSVLESSEKENELLDGSYIRLAKHFYQSMHDEVKRYLAWNPPLLGKKSRLGGAFWRLIGLDKTQSLVDQEIDNAYYFLNSQFKKVMGMHLDLKPFNQLMNAYFDKTRAINDRDYKAYSRLRIGVALAPLVPVSMYLSAGLLSSAGLATLNATSFTLTTTGLLTSANVSAFITLGLMSTVVGTTVYSHHLDKKYGVSDGLGLFDKLLFNLTTSMPSIAASNILIASTAYTITSFAVGAKELMASLPTLMRNASALSGNALMAKLKTMPITLLKKYASAWWSNKVLFFKFFVDTGVAISLEIATRQLLADGPDRKFFIKDEDGNVTINPDSQYSIIAGTISRAIAYPLVKVDNFALRYLMYNLIGTISGATSAIIMNGEIDFKKIKFSRVYSIVVASAMGEFNRKLRFSKMNSGDQTKVGVKDALIDFLMSLAYKSVSTTISNAIYDDYADNESSFLNMIRSQVETSLNLDLEGVSNLELKQSLERLEIL